jgi:hypothetical protein
MRGTTDDLTLNRNYIQTYQFLIAEYELVKSKKHPSFKYVKDFYLAHGTSRQSFLKYYNRFLQSGRSVESLLPEKRGPKWKSRRTIPFIEQKVIALREKGNNRYEITSILKPKLNQFTPSPSTVYLICKRYGKNRLTPKMEKEKRQIIKTKAGELAHIDAHYLNKGIIQGQSKRYYLVAVVDSCTRLAWAEIVEDLRSLSVMFATMRCFQVLSEQYNVKFAEALTDNGPEFGTKVSKNKANHPFERMLIEMGVKHRYIRPYRPQTNGKVERFWRTIEDDLLRETYFESIDNLEKELQEYLYYYNHERPHQGLDGKSPAIINEKCQRIT